MTIHIYSKGKRHTVAVQVRARIRPVPRGRNAGVGTDSLTSDHCLNIGVALDLTRRSCPCPSGVPGEAVAIQTVNIRALGARCTSRAGSPLVGVDCEGTSRDAGVLTTLRGTSNLDSSGRRWCSISKRCQSCSEEQ